MSCSCVCSSEAEARKCGSEAGCLAAAAFRTEHAERIANARDRLSDSKVGLMVFCLYYGVLCASSRSDDILVLMCIF